MRKRDVPACTWIMSRRKTARQVKCGPVGEEKKLMKTQVEFKSNIFPPYDGEEEEINPVLWGKRLAEYLQENLPKHRMKVTCIGADDWGWMVELENEDFRYGSDAATK